MQNFIDTNSLNIEQINQLLSLAQANIQKPEESSNVLKNKKVANLFFENSTRTKCSFALAAKELGAKVIDVDVATSSVNKGETILDTAQTIDAMQIDFLVLRMAFSGYGNFLAKHLNAKIINAGDGLLAHPSQALLDLLTLKQNLGDVSNKTITIVGDILHSRVARSNIDLLSKLGANIQLLAPISFLPEYLTWPKNISIERRYTENIYNSDAIMYLRVQKERMLKSKISLCSFTADYGLNNQRYNKLKKDCLILHPGPVNRNVEISSEILDKDNVKILEQVRNGVAMRKAIFQFLSN